MALVVYVFEESRGVPTHERDLFEIDAAGYFVDMSAVFVECCTCTSPMSSRPAFQRALRRLQAGDTLVTTQLLGLGNSVSDVLATIEQMGRRGVVTVCLAYGKQDLCAAEGQPFIDALRLAEDLERVTRRSRAREAANAAKERGVAQGRPSSLTPAQQQQAIDFLGAGRTVTDIARTLNTSRQTIMRLRNAHRQAPDATRQEDALPEPLAANDSK
ncbi:recombinase family protein [Caballeronia sp. LZ035]|uniref:recombinase family protein n=1 Tax=Caballeronia sp. LZ035 TaxID=3038568 RepID=UPI0028656107|nr:recombinase family protein [Caballeronia sp. LZ035]MDR5758491.1 recombinase family protein [Caballeronia sp. LZ035]